VEDREGGVEEGAQDGVVLTVPFSYISLESCFPGRLFLWIDTTFGSRSLAF
jgi:hypothetical protein